jgi:hypothetical protein
VIGRDAVSVLRAVGRQIVFKGEKLDMEAAWSCVTDFFRQRKRVKIELVMQPVI